MRVVRLSLALLLLLSAAHAVEIAELRNGFSIRHCSREVREDQVRLYLDEARHSYLDVPAAEVAGYSSEPDPEPSAPTSADAAPKAPPVRSTAEIVAEASHRHGVDSDFIASVIRQESAGNPRAVSRAGAQGLMQLMPATARQLGVADSFSPEQNVHGGAAYLRELLERYNGDALKALAAYNAGPAAVERYKGVPPYRETRNYVARVVRDYNKSKSRAAKLTAAKPTP